MLEEAFKVLAFLPIQLDVLNSSLLFYVSLTDRAPRKPKSGSNGF
jgi:hypothetical protein